MPPRRTKTEPNDIVAIADDGSDGSDGTDAPTSIVRRAPFADNPHVGARGQRTQQRILDAALQVFGEVGYHQTGIARITKVAGCSRASFYQYFSRKEDVFRHLAGQVARQLAASIENLDPVTDDADGWTTLRAWVARHGDIYDRYQPVFAAFQAAAEADEVVATGSVRVSERHLALLRSKLSTAPLPARQLDPVLRLLTECITRTHDSVRTLQVATADSHPQSRVDDALTDVVHRTLFGLHPDVNVHPPARRRPPVLALGPAMREAVERDDATSELTAAGQRTLDALLDAGRAVFVKRGFHSTRVDDVVQAAGVSHGAFYRYFTSKEQLAQVLAGLAMRTVSGAFQEVPDNTVDGGAPSRTALRRWLRHYGATQATEAAMIRVWVDAAVQDEALAADSAAAVDWGRRQIVRFLRPRGFGDLDTEAVIMLALLSAFGTRVRSPAATDAAAYIVERGLLGQ